MMEPDFIEEEMRAAGRTVGCDCGCPAPTRRPAITLDGHPAIVTGYHNRFATVATLEHGHGGPVEFSWAAVAHVLARGGAFRS